MIRFEKVSFNEYIRTWASISKNETLIKYLNSEEKNEWSEKIVDLYKKQYEAIKLPTRATKGSAGYDFYTPIRVPQFAGSSNIVPTGIRCIMDEDTVLMLYPKSGLGCKYNMRLMNTTGVIDSDYAHSDNEGHILVSMCSGKDFVLQPGDKFCQGVFIKYCTVDDDNVTADRNGGFGSTGN